MKSILLQWNSFLIIFDNHKSSFIKKSNFVLNREELLELLLKDNDIDTKPLDNLLIKYKVKLSKFLDIKIKYLYYILKY